MNKYEKILNELHNSLSDKEIVEHYIVSADFDDQEKEKTEEEFRQLRLTALKERTETQRILSELMRMKLLIRDYLERPGFEQPFSFEYQLAGYIKVIGRSQKDFSGEIDLHPTKLSRILHGRENPNVELTYRLEKHCGGIIPAIYWWKLYAKRLEEEIRTDEKRRRMEEAKVKNVLTFRA